MQLMSCIDKGITSVQPKLDEVAVHVADLRRVHRTLDPATGSAASRRNDFDEIALGFRASSSRFHSPMAGIMERFAPGLFVEGPDDLPCDNLDLERWFRRPKGHERRIHGHAHAGVRIVQEGPTLLPTLDAHLRHPAPFSAAELIPTLGAVPPPCQLDAERRRKLMRRARSRKQRPILLADLERRHKRVLGL